MGLRLNVHTRFPASEFEFGSTCVRPVFESRINLNIIIIIIISMLTKTRTETTHIDKKHIETTHIGKTHTDKTHADILLKKHMLR